MSKNIQKVQEMLDGDYKNKIQTGYESKTETHRVGDKWEDSDGVRWEQKDGYRSKLRNVPDMGLFSKQCKDCKKNCSLDKRDKNTFVRMDRCFHCQLNFEIELKSKSRFLATSIALSTSDTGTLPLSTHSTNSINSLRKGFDTTSNFSTVGS